MITKRQKRKVRKGRVLVNCKPKTRWNKGSRKRVKSLLTQFKIRSRNNKDDTIFLGLPPVILGMINDAQGITFFEWKFFGAGSSVWEQGGCWLRVDFLDVVAREPSSLAICDVGTVPPCRGRIFRRVSFENNVLRERYLDVSLGIERIQRSNPESYQVKAGSDVQLYFLCNTEKGN